MVIGPTVRKMAKDINNVRVEERIKIKIGEAKNLPPAGRHVAGGPKDLRCTLSLDEEEIFYTGSVQRSSNPFFGEEFQFEVPRKFRMLLVALQEGPRVLGQVALKRESLHQFHNKDHWFPLAPPLPGPQVQGKVHVNLKWDQCLFRGSTGGRHSAFRRLAVRVLECSDLATPHHGSCDPYVVVSLYRHDLHDSKKTKVRKKTANPGFDEVFYFDVPMKGGQNHDRLSLPPDLCSGLQSAELRITVMHDSAAGMFGGVFLGQVRIPLMSLSHTDAWYFLQTRSEDKPEAPSPPNLGTVRLKICYTSDHVFPSHFYHPLRQLLLDSPDVEPVTSSGAYVLGELVTNKLEAAQPLTKIFLHHGRLVPLIRSLADWEVSKVTDPNTIFRGNSLVSKCMDECMKLTGMAYLQQTLKPLLAQIFAEKRSCEIDPTRLKENESLPSNLECLLHYCREALRAIVASAPACPAVVTSALAALREAAQRHFPDCPEVQRSVVSGFIFLRFFAPAILGPKLFGLAPPQALDPQVTRTLTLLSKAVQILGNQVSSKSPRLQNLKEDYTMDLYSHFVTENHLQAVCQFLELVSCPSPLLQSDCPILLKEGALMKRGQGKRPFGIKTIRKRYFRLTSQELSYSKDKGGAVLHSIPTAEICGVGREADGFVVELAREERPLHLQAPNCVEEKSWLDLLGRICQLGDPLGVDSDREMERIHTLFLSHLDKLEALLETCEGTPEPGPTGEDPQVLWETLKRIRSLTLRLEQEHQRHLATLCRNTPYGSKQAPIGDDNYLTLIAQHCCK